MILKRMKWLLGPLLACVLILILMKTILFLGYVPSESMEPTIPAGSWILGCRVYGQAKKGDIVIFEYEGKTLVKRVAATEGDTICINDLNRDIAINEELISATRTLTVPSGHLFMLGDNSSVSIDSRYWREPFIIEESIIAKVF